MEHELIQKGGFSTVFKIDDMHAMKKIEIMHNIDTIKNEISILKKIHTNQHIISLHEVTNDDYFYYITMELYDEDILKYLINSKKVSENEAIIIFTQMSRSIEFIHSNQICHRDIKLENFLRKKDSIVLTDFGLSCDLSKSKNNLCTGKVGSKSYCAPEIFEHLKNDGYKCDIWSLGICLSAMICGFFPFRQALREDWRYDVFYKNEKDGINSIFVSYDNINLHISTEIYTFIHTMICVEPNRRSDAAQVLFECLNLNRLEFNNVINVIT